MGSLRGDRGLLGCLFRPYVQDNLFAQGLRNRGKGPSSRSHLRIYGLYHVRVGAPAVVPAKCRLEFALLGHRLGLLRW